MYKLEPFPKGLLVELVTVEKTKDGIFLPDGVKASDTEDYKGETIVGIGSDVTKYQVGDQVMFFNNVTPTVFRLKDDDGNQRTYMIFWEHDVACKIS